MQISDPFSPDFIFKQPSRGAYSRSVLINKNSNKRRTLIREGY